jgi:hypothetical protein
LFFGFWIRIQPAVSFFIPLLCRYLGNRRTAHGGFSFRIETETAARAKQLYQKQNSYNSRSQIGTKINLNRPMKGVPFRKANHPELK